MYRLNLAPVLVLTGKIDQGHDAQPDPSLFLRPTSIKKEVYPVIAYFLI